jgi:hypothetical protein
VLVGGAPHIIENFSTRVIVATLLLEEWEDDSHTPEMGTRESIGTWESIGTFETSEFDSRDQNTSH